MGSIKIKGATSGSMVLTVPDTGSDNVPVDVDSLLAKTGDGSGLTGIHQTGTQSNPAKHPSEIVAANAWTGDGLYYIQTANGVKQTYCINDGARQYMVIGKFAGSAADSVADTIYTGDFIIQDSSPTQFSCNFGEMVIEEIRFIGTDTISNWETSRNIDFIHGINFKPWKKVFNQVSLPQAYVNAHNGAGLHKYGYKTTYCSDGRGRWHNAGYHSHLMSDALENVTEGAFTSPGSFYLNAASDAKFTAHNDRPGSGQDTYYVVGFGRDDNLKSFNDSWPSESNDMTGGLDYSTAVYVLIR